MITRRAAVAGLACAGERETRRRVDLIAPTAVSDALRDMAQRWPERLWVVRHGESLGNVARMAADEAGAHVIETGGRDVDVPLSPLGEQQAEALGHWFADQRPEVILASPYLRARRSALPAIAATASFRRPRCARCTVPAAARRG